MTSAGTCDPFAVVTRIATEPGQTPQVLGKTEVVENTTSPTWATNFAFDYELGTPMRLAVSVYHKRGGKDGNNNESMGAAIFDVAETLGARGSTKAKKVKGGTLFATIRKSEGAGTFRFKFRGEKVSHNCMHPSVSFSFFLRILILTIHCVWITYVTLQLKNVEGWLRKSDPFYEIYRNVNNAGANTWELVYRSEVVKDNLNPDWKEHTIDLSMLCGGNLDLPIRVKAFDHERSGKHVFMGMFETTVKSLVEAFVDEDVNRGMKLHVEGNETGLMVVEQAEVSLPSDRAVKLSVPAPVVEYKSKPSFVDYINGGCKLNVVVAIDFTGSNGNPREPGTLHYLDPNGGYNDYQKAIRAIVDILAKYDDDKKFPVFGFGAKYGGEVRHCFQCGPEAEAEGVKGVLDAYRAVFSSGLIMSKPTLFDQVIDVANKRSRAMQEQAEAEGEQSYTILLILTDGAVADAGATMQALERAVDAPLSIVIVGVGNEDFSDMRFLDDAPAKFGRDMVQFVEFNNYCEKSPALTSHTLQEIPDQLVSYFQARGIDPLPPIQVEEEEIAVDPEEEEEIDLSLDIGEDEIVVSGGGVNVYDSFAQ